MASEDRWKRLSGCGVAVVRAVVLMCSSSCRLSCGSMSLIVWCRGCVVIMREAARRHLLVVIHGAVVVVRDGAEKRKMVKFFL